MVNFPGMPGGPGQFPQGRPPGQFPPGGGGGQQQAPMMAPPQYTPEQPAFSTFAVDPGAIRGCMFQMTYIWLNNGANFWFYPTFLGRRSIAGFRWSNRRGWQYFGIDLNQIRSFTCNPRRPGGRRRGYEGYEGYEAYDGYEGLEAYGAPEGNPGYEGYEGYHY